MVIAVCLCLRSVITSSQSNQTFGRHRKLSADCHRTFTPFLRRYALPVRALAVIPAVGLTLLGGCGGTEKHPNVAADAARPHACAPGSFQRLGSTRLAYPPIVPLRVRLYKGGKLVLSSKAAVGAPATPTPTGRFYVNQRLIPMDKSGPFGPGAVGVSAFSNVLTGWAQGGPIAIHGTNAPWSIGKAVSNGCIRIPNAKLRRLFSEALNGTPVLLRRGRRPLPAPSPLRSAGARF